LKELLIQGGFVKKIFGFDRCTDSRGFVCLAFSFLLAESLQGILLILKVFPEASSLWLIETLLLPRENSV
jgi:hypothetical protein